MVEDLAALGGFDCLRWNEEGDRHLSALTPDDWDALVVDLDARAGLQLLARRLRRTGVRPPARIAARLKANGMALAARTLQSQVQLAAVISATKRPAMLLKGVDLADRLYGNLAHRSMGDVDLLVQDEDAMAYHAALRAVGLNSTDEPDIHTRALPWQHHTVYSASEPHQLPFELHWRLTSGDFGTAVDLPGIWHRSEPHARFGPLGRVMASEDLLIYLCLHMRQHLFEVPLTSLWDIAELIDCPALPLDWPTIWQRARAWRLENSVQMTLYLVNRTLGVPTAHLSTWVPAPEVIPLLPERMATLGKFSPALKFSNRWLGRTLAADVGWLSRGRALLRGLVPPRLMVRQQFGHADQSPWQDVISYVRRLRAIWRERLATACDWRKLADEDRARVSRLVSWRSHLDRSSQEDKDDTRRQTHRGKEI